MDEPKRIRITGPASSGLEVDQEYDVYEWNEVADAPKIFHAELGLITVDLSVWEDVAPEREIEEGDVVDISIPFKRKDDALHFTFADTSVTITDDDDNPVGKIEALLGGGMKFVHYNDEGDREQYVASAKDLWNAFNKHFGRTENIMD